MTSIENVLHLAVAAAVSCHFWSFSSEFGTTFSPAVLLPNPTFHSCLSEIGAIVVVSQAPALYLLVLNPPSDECLGTHFQLNPPPGNPSAGSDWSPSLKSGSYRFHLQTWIPPLTQKCWVALWRTPQPGWNTQGLKMTNKRLADLMNDVLKKMIEWWCRPLFMNGGFWKQWHF